MNTMIIEGDAKQRHFPYHVEPVFQALLSGIPIRSITLMKGTANKDTPEMDYTIENVVANSYWQGMGYSYDKQTEKYIPNDYVVASPSNFWMNWVRSFEL